MERIDGDVRAELGRLPGAPGTMGVAAVWEDAVGPEIARNAWPGRVARDGTLHVATSSAAWAFELTHLAPVLLERLRAALGDAAPTAVRFAPGRVPEPSSKPQRASVERREPTVRSSREAERLTASIADEELRERVRRAVALGLSYRPAGRRTW